MYNLRFSGIPERFKESSFETYIAETKEQKKAKDICFKYAENFEKFCEKGTSMILYGTPGTGKTHTSVSIVRYIIEKKKKTAKFFNVINAFNKIKETYNKNSEETEQQAIDYLVKPDLLVLDELGMSFRTDAEKLLLDRIINERYENVKPTILITNLNWDNLKTLLGERVMDRMRDSKGLKVLFNWHSHRG